MRVGMKKTVFHNHLDDGPGAAISQYFPVQSRIIDSDKIPALNPLNILLYIEPLTGPLPIDFRNPDIEVIG